MEYIYMLILYTVGVSPYGQKKLSDSDTFAWIFTFVCIYLMIRLVFL